MDFGNSLGNLATSIFYISTPPNLPLQRGGIILYLPYLHDQSMLL